MKKERLILCLLFMAAIALRLILLFTTEQVISADGVVYISLARRFASGQWSGFLDTYWSPLYPLLTGVAVFFSNHSELPGIIVSILCSSLLTLFVYQLIKQHYGKNEALLGAILTSFYPHLLGSSLQVDPESLYVLLVTIALYVGWQAITENRKLFITGLLLGFAYLTRPESAGYVILFALMMLSGKFAVADTTIKQRLYGVCKLSAGWLLLAAPYLIYLRRVTGNWTLSAKFKAHILAANFAHERPSRTVLDIVGDLFSNIDKEHSVLPYLLPLLLIMLLALGLFRSDWTMERARKEFYFLLFVGATLLGYALSVVEVIYLYVLLPVLFAWVARGVVEFALWCQRLPLGKFESKDRTIFLQIICVALLFVYLLPLNNFMRRDEAAWQYTRYELKMAGLRLGEMKLNKPRIMAMDDCIAYYAQGQHLQMPIGTYEQVITAAQTQGADFVVFDERNLHVMEWWKDIQSKNQPQLELVLKLTPREGFTVLIYRVRIHL